MIKEGDTLSKVARSFGLTLEELLAANKDTIKNPDRIVVGDEIIIPVPTPTRSTAEPAVGVAGALTRRRALYLGAMLMAVIRPASTRNVASMCWVGAPGRTTRRSAS